MNLNKKSVLHENIINEIYNKYTVTKWTKKLKKIIDKKNKI